MSFPWPAGASTGLGSLPELDPVQAAELVLGEVAGLPYLPELPGRGLGADTIGRTASLLVDLPVEWQAHGWTMASRASRDSGRARDWLSWDIDAFTERAQGADVVKVQLCGPMTLAASMELPLLHKVISDHGAFADLASSLAEGAAQHVADLANRLPGTAIVLQIDEPSLPAVLAGRVPTPSGYGTVRSLDISRARAALSSVLEAAAPGHRAVHCCAVDPPIALMVEAGANAVSIDLGLVQKKGLDQLGECIDNGVSLWLGIIAGVESATPLSLASARARIDGFWNQLGFARELLAGAVVPTPSCGMAGASSAYVRRAMKLLGEVGRSMTE